MNTSFALVSFFVGGLLIGNLAVMADRSQRDFEHESAVKNTADEMVTNTETNIVTETEVYKVVCTSDGEGYCKEYSVRKINRE